MGDWDTTVLSGPEGEDWRVPVSELENRLERLARALRVAALPGALIQHPIDLYYFIIIKNISLKFKTILSKGSNRKLKANAACKKL